MASIASDPVVTVPSPQMGPGCAHHPLVDHGGDHRQRRSSPKTARRRMSGSAMALRPLLALRLLWGLIGPKEARFTAFPPSPSRAIAHVKEIFAGRNTPHASHNPLGALMVYAIWGTLAVIIGSGISMAGLPGSQAQHERSIAERQRRDHRQR